MLRFLWLAALALLLSGCPGSSETQVLLRGERFTVEVADTEESRNRGLMFRDHLAADRGMLFVFPDEQPRAFWMFNTRISLDILYFDRDYRLVGLQENVPPCRDRQGNCPSYPSGAMTQYVLELNAGTARRLGVQRGDVLEVIPGRGRRG